MISDFILSYASDEEFSSPKIRVDHKLRSTSSEPAGRSDVSATEGVRARASRITKRTAKRSSRSVDSKKADMSLLTGMSKGIRVLATSVSGPLSDVEWQHEISGIGCRDFSIPSNSHQQSAELFYDCTENALKAVACCNNSNAMKVKLFIEQSSRTFQGQGKPLALKNICPKKEWRHIKKRPVLGFCSKSKIGFLGDTVSSSRKLELVPFGSNGCAEQHFSSDSPVSTCHYLDK